MKPLVSVFIATSVDGYIAREDGSIDWLNRVQVEGEDYGFHEFYASIDTLIMGRNTYDTARDFPEWPFVGKAVWVLTHRPLEPLHGEKPFSGKIADLLSSLKASCHVYLDGGTIITQGLQEDVIDKMVISRIPVLLGKGKPLFGPFQELDLVLESSESFGSGLVQERYSFSKKPLKPHFDTWPSKSLRY